MRPAPSLRNGVHAGFTLIELMVTVSLAAVLLSIAIPSFSQMMASNRLTTQSNDFVGALNFARSEAITRNVNTSFCRVAAVGDDVCADDTDPWQNWIVRTATGTVIRRGDVTTASGIGVTSTLTGDWIVFGSDGLATTGGVLISGSATRINVCSSSASGSNIRRVTLGGGSRISTEKLDGPC